VRARHLNAGVDRIPLEAAQPGFSSGRRSRRLGVRVVAFDKTGTVTTGRLTLDALHRWGKRRQVLECRIGRITNRASINVGHSCGGKARGITPPFR
jgi:hypothetical protein